MAEVHCSLPYRRRSVKKENVFSFLALSFLVFIFYILFYAFFEPPFRYLREEIITWL